MSSWRRLLPLLLIALLALAPVRGAPEKWAADIDRLTAGDATHPPATDGTVFIGSSSIRRWATLAEDFPDVGAVNRGFGGSELADSVFYFERLVLPHRPRAVVVYAGENDLWAGQPPEKVLADFRAFRTKLQATLPDARLLYLAIKESPQRARIRDQVLATNRLIAAECAADPRCTFVDVATPLLDARGGTRPELYVEDGVHLRPEGYRIWTAVLGPVLAR